MFSTYRLGQIIFFSQTQRQVIFSKGLPAPLPDNEMVAPLGLAQVRGGGDLTRQVLSDTGEQETKLVCFVWFGLFCFFA